MILRNRKTFSAYSPASITLYNCLRIYFSCLDGIYIIKLLLARKKKQDIEREKLRIFDEITNSDY